MDELIEDFFVKYPQHAAKVLESDQQASSLLAVLHHYPKYAANLLQYLSPSFVADELEQCPHSEVLDILNDLSVISAGAIIRAMTPVAREKILAGLDSKHSERIKAMLKFSIKQVGYYVVQPDLVVSESLSPKLLIESLEKLGPVDPIVAVLNSNYGFVGCVDFVALARQAYAEKASIKSAIDKKVAVYIANTPIERIVDDEDWQNDKPIFIVNRANKFLGVFNKADFVDSYKPIEETQIDEPIVDGYIKFSDVIWGYMHKMLQALE